MKYRSFINFIHTLSFISFHTHFILYLFHTHFILYSFSYKLYPLFLFIKNLSFIHFHTNCIHHLFSYIYSSYIYNKLYSLSIFILTLSFIHFQKMKTISIWSLNPPIYCGTLYTQIKINVYGIMIKSKMNCFVLINLSLSHILENIILRISIKSQHEIQLF